MASVTEKNLVLVHSNRWQDRADFETIVNLMVQTGVLDHAIPFEEFVDTTFAEGAHAMTPWPNGLSQVIYPHNLLLNFWVATGVLGVVAFVVLLIQAFRITWRGWRTGWPCCGTTA